MERRCACARMEVCMEGVVERARAWRGAWRGDVLACAWRGAWRGAVLACAWRGAWRGAVLACALRCAWRGAVCARAWKCAWRGVLEDKALGMFAAIDGVAQRSKRGGTFFSTARRAHLCTTWHQEIKSKPAGAAAANALRAPTPACWAAY
eukprot:354923-Chlamydomonas_euryale.AAC.1